MTSMDNFTIHTGEDGIALVTFDVPGRSMNVITAAVQRDLGTLVESIRADAAIRGVILRSGKASGFCAGADLDEMESEIARLRSASTQDELRAGVESAGEYSRRLRALETCGKPVVAVIAGTALGGGLELALACHHRVASDDPGLKLGLPESSIGLMPGAGATQRLPRLMGIAGAIPHLVDAVLISPADALASGVVGAIAAESELIDAARAWIDDGGSAVAPWDVKGYKPRCGGPHSNAGYSHFASAIATAAGSGAINHPAQANILRSVYEGMLVPIDAGLRIESRYFFNTVRSAAASVMVKTLFHGRRAVARAKTPTDSKPFADSIRLAWSAECQRLIDEGIPAALVHGVSRRLSPKLTSKMTAGESSPNPHLVDADELRAVEQRLLAAAANAAHRSLEDGLASGPAEADLLAIDAGYPAWTGGPITYSESPVRT